MRIQLRVRVESNGQVSEKEVDVDYEDGSVINDGGSTETELACERVQALLDTLRGAK